MDKLEAKQYVIKYLNDRNIAFTHYMTDGEMNIVLVLKGHDNCPDDVLECCFFFYETCMEARVYFDENASSWISDNSERLPEMYRLLNYINARFWPFNNDGMGGQLYSPHHLLTPRFYITEDEQHDLTATMCIDYDVLELAPLEVCDYITATLPAYMNELSPTLFLVLVGEMSVEDGIKSIEELPQ